MSAVLVLLDRAHEHVTAGELSEALGLLVDAWNAKRATEIANAIEALGARARSRDNVEPPTGKTPKERNDAWNAAAKKKDPVMHGALFASLTETKGSAETLLRIEHVLKTLPKKRAPDPRFAAKIGDLIEVPIYNASVGRTNTFWKALFDLLPRLGDPRLLARARTWPAKWNANRELNQPEKERLPRRLEACMPSLVKAYGAGPAELLADEAARMDGLLKAIAALSGSTSAGSLTSTAARKRTDEEFLAAIFAAPEDDDVRLVYADYLQERNDPRGEFITLQIARARAGKTTREKRERDLQAEFAVRWMGSLAKKVKKTSAKFERGFLASAAPMSDVDDDPAWSTLVALDGVLPSAKACRMPLLRVAKSVSGDHIRRLADHDEPFPIEELEYLQSSGYRSDFGDERKAIMVLRTTKLLPKLRSLRIGGWIPAALEVQHYAWAWEAQCAKNLKELAFPMRMPSQLQEFLSAIEKTKIERVVMWGTTDVNDRDGIGMGWGWHVIAERDAATSSLSRLTLVCPNAKNHRNPERFGREPVEALAALNPKQLTYLRVAIPEVNWKLHTAFEKRLSEAIAKQTRLEEPLVEQATK